MKYIFLSILMVLSLNAGLLKSPIIMVDNENEVATLKVDKIDVGMSGFVVHAISKNHSSILKNAVVASYNASTKIATLKLSEYNGLKNNSLPTGKWSVVPGDIAVFAFGYSRALLIAPSEEIYYRISKSVNLEWIHPDMFATILSFNGHPTPQKSDFSAMSIATSVGLVFVYLDEKVYMLDIKTFKIFSITDAPFKQNSTKLPFYSRVNEIESNWWGAGSSEMDEYAPHYYELLVEYNKRNQELFNAIKKANPKLHYLLSRFEIGN